jgi:TolB-like protein
MGTGQISFGPFVLDRSSRMLLSGGKPVALGQRAFALLDSLAGADGPVDKAALMEAAWPGVVVEEGNLTVQIAALRKALGTRPDGSEWIVTVPRVGYRLLKGSSSDAATERDVNSPLASLAVLPFQNMSSDPEQDYFADGIVEDLITAMSRFHSIQVAGRNSALAFKGKAIDVREVARELQVRYVLEGSVRRAGDNLRITAQLVEGSTGAHLWAEHFDGPIEDVFSMQDRITAGVVAIVEPLIQRVEIERTRLKPPSSLGSYDLYLQATAVTLSTEAGANERAVALIERSLAIDPDFPPALALGAGIELARFDRQQAGASEAARLKGLDYAHRALAAQGADATTRAIAALGAIILGFEYDSGMAALRRAVSDNPNSVRVLGYAGVGALRSGELEEAERYQLRAIELNPADFTGQWQFTAMANIRLLQHRFDEAVTWSHQALSLSASNPISIWLLAVALAHLGRIDEAASWRVRLEEILPNCTLASIRRGQSMRNPAHLEILIEGLRLAGLRER